MIFETYHSCAGFNLTGDFVRGHGLEALGALLNKGVKIALMYGDRDYQCNWLGGEAISLAIDSTISSDFVATRYANIQTNSTYVGGLVRQYGNLSFSRVFQAGHEGKITSIYDLECELILDSSFLPARNSLSDFQSRHVQQRRRNWEDC